MQETSLAHFADPAPLDNSDCALNTEQSLSQLTELLSAAARDESDSLDRPTDFEPTEGRIAVEMERVAAKTLSPELTEWIAVYGKVGDRSPYLWTWCRQGVELTTLSSVADAWFDRICDTKVLGVMFDVLVDDVADRGGDAGLLEQLTSLRAAAPLQMESLSPADQEYCRLTLAVWEALQQRIRELPRYEEFAEFLRFDYAQLLNAMRYAHLLNRFPTMMNVVEHDLYLPHNMHMMASATIDLMASPGFDIAELGRLREAVWRAQYMGRIGNLVSTWQREIGEGDFTSGVFARAVVSGELKLRDFRAANRKEIERRIIEGGHEQFFLHRWQLQRRELIALEPSVATVDLRKLIEGLERLICLHLGSRGRK